MGTGTIVDIVVFAIGGGVAVLSLTFLILSALALFARGSDR